MVKVALYSIDFVAIVVVTVTTATDAWPEIFRRTLACWEKTVMAVI